jgi:hypothetical protein
MHLQFLRWLCTKDANKQIQCHQPSAWHTGKQLNIDLDV